MMEVAAVGTIPEGCHLESTFVNYLSASSAVAESPVCCLTNQGTANLSN